MDITAFIDRWKNTEAAERVAYPPPMHRSPKPWPLVIVRALDACMAAVKAMGTHGRGRVYEATENGQTVYIVAIVIPAGETVLSRAHGSGGGEAV